MNKRYFSFIIYLPLILQSVTFNSSNTGIFVLSCKSAAPRTGKNLEEIRIGKNLQIFKTYKKRPASDASQENRIVKTLVFPENYPTAGTNNAYLDINDQISTDVDEKEHMDMIGNPVHSIHKKGMIIQEPITEDFPQPSQEKNNENVENISTESKKEEEDEIKKEGSGSDKNLQENYIDNIRRRGELGSTRKDHKDSSTEEKEHGLLVDEEIKEDSGMHEGHQEKNEAQERSNLSVKKRNSDELEYGKTKNVHYKNNKLKKTIKSNSFCNITLHY